MYCVWRIVRRLVPSSARLTLPLPLCTALHASLIVFISMLLFVVGLFSNHILWYNKYVCIDFVGVFLTSLCI